ncbi:MAG TPA: exosortase/archaeosortase family protein [Candidatus Dormibacteraeota bacterium]|nr:exosortase/archaeosortase family protein [Candidatus Dormibacteraeota bacterium]
MPSIEKRIRTSILGLCREFKTRDAYPLLLIVFPIAFLITADPASFTLVWFVGQQVGRAGIAFVFFLVAWDFHDSRKKFKATRDRRRYVLVAIILVALLVYYYFRIFNGFFERPPINPANNTPMDSAFTTYLRVYVTSHLGVSQDSPLSFLLAMDYLTYAVYCMLATVILYSSRSTLLMATPVIYTVGSAILDMMDAFFPENSLAFLQVWVYLIWNVVVFILGLTGFHTNVDPLKGPINPPSLWLRGNQLTLYGFKGNMPLVIYWPSSGVVSMIVYSLVILVLMVKLDASRTRKIIYAIIGGVGTYFVNVMRISLIVLYITYISLDFEAFHASIGEVLFIIWIFIYLLLVIHFENTNTKKQPARARLPHPKRTPVRDSAMSRGRVTHMRQAA